MSVPPAPARAVREVRLGTAAAAPERRRAVLIAGTSQLFLAARGGIAAPTGAPTVRGALRVTLWIVAMGLTALAGRAFGISVA